MARGIGERVLLTLALTLCVQLASWLYLWARLQLYNANAHECAENYKFPSISATRFSIGLISSGIFIFTLLQPHALNPPGIAFILMAGMAPTLDAWIERYPLDLAIAAMILGWMSSPNSGSLLLQTLSTAIALSFGGAIFSALRRFSGDTVIAWGDVLFAATLSSRFGFVAGLSALGGAMFFAGLSSFAVRRINPTVSAVPLIPFMALTFAMIRFIS